MDEREAFLENYGRFLSAWGQGDTAGKILGMLMIGQKPKKTLDEIAERVGRSKSTVHSAIKNLEKIGIVTKTIDDDVPSEGRYPYLYGFNPNFFEIGLRKADSIPAFKQLISDAIGFLKTDDMTDSRIEDYEKIVALYGWWESILRNSFQEWEKLVETGEYRKYLS